MNYGSFKKGHFYRFYGVINSNLKFLFKLSLLYTKKVRREVQHFQAVELGILSKFMKLKKSSIRCSFLLERLWLLAASFFSMTMIPNTIPTQQKHTHIEKHTMKRYQSWTGCPRVQTKTLLKQCEIILTENVAKGRNIHSDSECTSGSQEIYCYNKTAILISFIERISN